jgi:hypothetical protein
MLDLVQSRLTELGYSPAGNCYETALALGLLLAASPEHDVRLIRGVVRSLPHFWLHVDGALLDPTAAQFPLLTLAEYQFPIPESIDLAQVAYLLGLS